MSDFNEKEEKGLIVISCWIGLLAIYVIPVIIILLFYGIPDLIDAAKKYLVGI